MTLLESFENTTNKYPHSKAIVFKNTKITYRELNTMVNRMRNGLASSGISYRDRIAILLPNCPEYIASYYAITTMGAIAVPLNNFLSPEEIAYILNDCEINSIVTSKHYLDNLKTFIPSLRNLKNIISIDFHEKLDFIDKSFFIFNELLKIQTAGMIMRIVVPEDIACIIYTSGTTGHPKGAMLTHGNLISNINSISRALEVKHRDRFLLFLPLFHSFTATVCMILPIHFGATIIMLEGINKKEIKKSIIWHRPTFFVGIPSVYNVMARTKPSFIARLLNPIRIYVSGAAPLPVEVLKKFDENYRVPLLEGYGLSEASPVVSVNPLKGVRKPGSVGLPLPGVEVKIVDEDERELPSGEIGEIIVKGKNVMKGYYNNPDETARAIRGGWLFTGDIGKIDEDGYLYIIDRKKDLVIVRGCNVYPREVEEILYRHPRILEAAVIGVPDIHRGEVVKAFIVPKEGEELTPKEIKRYCLTHLARFKVPRIIELRKSLPKTPTGKILKKDLHG